MADAIGCIALDILGTTIAIGHGEKVSVIDQLTICVCALRPPHILTIGVFQPYGRTSGFSQTHPYLIILKKTIHHFCPFFVLYVGEGLTFGLVF